MPAFARFIVEKQIRTGLLVRDQKADYIGEINGSIYGEWRTTGRVYPLTDVQLLSPCTPTKIIGVGLNSNRFAAMLKADIPKEPAIFLKPPSSIIGSGAEIKLPAGLGRVDFEAEPALVIGKKAEAIQAHEARDYILGYTCANDITAMDKLAGGQPGALAKGFNTFTPLGPWIVTNVNPNRLILEAFLNGEQKQSGSTGEHVFKAFDIVAYISQIMTLEPGDVILMGTVPGKGPIMDGDEIEVRISGIGSLKNKVIEVPQ